MPKILIVDDDVTMTRMIMSLLMMEGHQATVLNDSTKAMEMAGTIQPDLITLDLMMPGLTGFDLCKLFRQDARFVTTPILIISARDDGGSRQQARELGASAYLTKPFNIDDLLEKVRDLTKGA